MEKNITLVIATRNKGKTSELTEILKEFPITIKNLDDFGKIPDVEEDGETFEENAYKKASFTARILGFPALADDSGICVEALNNTPGVYSARYCGENATDQERYEDILKKMKGISNRNAKFECVISIAVPSGAALTYEGSCEGVIADKPSGNGGFGYDPIFYYPPLNKTFAEMNSQEKNQISHRGRALKELKDEFEKVIKWIHQHMPMESVCLSDSR